MWQARVPLSVFELGKFVKKAVVDPFKEDIEEPRICSCPGDGKGPKEFPL